MTRHSITKIFKIVYQKVIANEKDEVNFWIFIFFILAFSTSRLVVYFAPELYIPVRHTHIHHFAYGIVILSVVGLMALNDWHHKKRRVFGAIYGIGLGLAMDEFGMWIRLDDDYWIRHSYDAIFITGSILVFLVYFENFWVRIIRRIIKGNDKLPDEEEDFDGS